MTALRDFFFRKCAWKPILCVNFFFGSVRETQFFTWKFLQKINAWNQNHCTWKKIKNSLRETRKPCVKKMKKFVRTPGKRSEILPVYIYKVPVTMTNRHQVSNDNQNVAVTIHAIFPWHVVLAPSFIVYSSFKCLRYIQVTPEIKRYLLCTAQKPN